MFMHETSAAIAPSSGSAGWQCLEFCSVPFTLHLGFTALRAGASRFAKFRFAQFRRQGVHKHLGCCANMDSR